MYDCKICGYKTPKKYNYERHIISCEKVFDKKDEVEKYTVKKTLNSCIYCNKNFTRKDTLIRHMYNTCKFKKEDKEEDERDDFITSYKKSQKEKNKDKKKDKVKSLESTISKQQNMIENLSKILEKAVDKVVDNKLTIEKPYSNQTEDNKPTQIINNINNTVNNTLNQQNNNFYNSIYINDYGKENLSYITKDMLKQLIKKPNKSIEEFAKMVHFHQDHPENVNVLIFSKRTNEIAVFKNGKWDLKKKDNFLDGFVGEKFDQLYDILDNHKDLIEDEKIERFEKYADKFGKLYGKERDNATEDVKNLISSESYYYSGHYQKTKKQIQKELFDKTGKMIPTANIIKKQRPDDESIGFIDGNPLEFMGDNEEDCNKKMKNHIHRIKDI